MSLKSRRAVRNMQVNSSRTEKLDFIPHSRRVAEVFGWQFGIWGALFIITALAFFPRNGESWQMFLFTAAAGIVLAGCEIRRHLNPTVLVRDGGYILIYRRGGLDMVLPADKIGLIKTDFHIMLNIGLGLGVAALIFIAVAVNLTEKENVWSADSLLILFWGLCILASLVMAAWTRFFCRHLRLPIRKTKWMEESVLIPKTRFKELFG